MSDKVDDFADALLEVECSDISHGERAKAYALATSVMLERAYGEKVADMFDELVCDIVELRSDCTWRLRPSDSLDVFNRFCLNLHQSWGIEPSIGEDDGGKFATFSIPPYWKLNRRKRFLKAIESVASYLRDE